MLGTKTPHDFTEAILAEDPKEGALKREGEGKEGKGEGEDPFEHSMIFLVSEISFRGKLPFPHSCIFYFLILSSAIIFRIFLFI